MTDQSRHDFDQTLLTGYLDRALTQGDEQKVRLHLEDCSACRAILDEMLEIREVTMTTQFHTPTDDQWDEQPRGLLSRGSVGLGWLILLLWLVGITGFVIGHVWTGSESFMEKLLVFGGIAGFSLLFLSVLLDRLKTLKTDRYREVKK